MELMLWLIPASIGLTLIAVGGFVWAVRTSQFEALDRHALDILDEPASVTGSASSRTDSRKPDSLLKRQPVVPAMDCRLEDAAGNAALDPGSARVVPVRSTGEASGRSPR